jgi:hypothetical protein
MYCPNCGTPNADGSKFCAKCGKAMPIGTAQPPAASAPQPATQTSPRRQNRTWIVVGIIVVAAIAVIALLSLSKSGPWKPTKPGVYLQANRTELYRERTMDPQQQGVPQTGEKQPQLLVYLPGEDTQYLQFMRVSNGKRNLGYQTLAYENGVYTIRPTTSALSPGVYCVVLGGPLMMPTDVSWWCFTVTP